MEIIDQSYLEEIDRLQQSGQATKEQEVFLLKAAELYKSLSVRAPNNPELKEAMAGLQQRAWGIYKILGRHDEAIAATKNEVRLRRDLLNENGDRGRRELAFALSHHAQALLGAGAADRASPVVEEYVQKIKKLVQEGGPAENLGIAYGLRAELLQQQGRLHEAIAQSRQAMELFDEIEDGLGWATLRKNKLKVRDQLGYLYIRVGDLENARQISEELFELYDQFAEEPLSKWSQIDQRTIEINWTGAAARIAFSLQHEDLDRAVKILRRAAKLSADLRKADPHDRPSLARMVRIHSLLSKGLFMQGQMGEAAKVIEAALDNMQDWPAIDSTRGYLLHTLGLCQFDVGDYFDCMTWIDLS